MEALELLRAQGDEEGQAMCLETLSAVACRQGDAAGGRRYATVALELCRRLQHLTGMAVSLLLLAAVAALEGWFARAGRLLGYANSMVGYSVTMSGTAQEDLNPVLAPAREALGEEAWAAAIAAGRALSLEEAVAEALGERTT
jgi:hypothetical protein